MTIDDYCAVPGSEDYKHVVNYVASEGADYEAVCPDEALSYIEELKRIGYEGGVYVIKVGKVYKIIQP